MLPMNVMGCDLAGNTSQRHVLHPAAVLCAYCTTSEACQRQHVSSDLKLLESKI